MNRSTHQPNPVSPAGPPETIYEEMPSVSDEINETVSLLMPWGISFMAHMAIVLLALFVVWSVKIVTEESRVIPQVTQNLDRQVKPLDPTDKVPIEPIRSAPTNVKTEAVERQDPSDTTIRDPDAVLPNIVGTPVVNPLPPGLQPPGDGFIGQPIPPSAREIVYVIDASGSLIDSLPFVLDKLKDSIRGLTPEHRFTVIFFQRGSALEKHPAGLTSATDAVKQRTMAWLDAERGGIIARGPTTPQRAIELALRYKPDLIFLLSDNITGHGRYALDSGDLIQMIDQTKQSLRSDTAISTVQYLYEDPMGTMRRIAEAHGGTYRFIDPSYVGLH